MGMLIDGSIVVTEYADRKISEGFQDLKPTDWVQKNVLSNSSFNWNNFGHLFLNIWPGYTGQFMKYLPMTVFFVLCASFSMR